MKTDIEIAQSVQMRPITEIAATAGIGQDYLDQYGKYKAKVDYALLKNSKRKNGKLVLVTAITPTPAGEGKTTTTVGLGMAMNKIGKNAIIALREPSLGPVFGVKGGAAGGGYAQVVPMEDINLHFTGDFHAIGAANNLLAAMLDNHIQQGNSLGIDVKKITWKRCVDMNDRQLRNITDGLGGRVNGVPREDAEICTDVLLESDRRGIESHGCNRFKPIYIDRIIAGIQKPVTEFEVLKDTVVLDPVNHMFASVTPEEYLNMMILSVSTGQSMD